MAFCPVVPGARLAKDKVVRSEDLAEGAAPNAIHGAGLQVNEDGPGDVLAATGLIVVDVDALELQISGALVGAGGVDAVLVRDDLPELEKVIVDSTEAAILCSRGDDVRQAETSGPVI